MCDRHTHTLTQFIKVCIDAVHARDGTHEPSLEERGPLVHQTPVTSHVILHTAKTNVVSPWPENTHTHGTSPHSLRVCCYLTQLSYPGDGRFAHVLSIHGVFFEKQEELVVLGIVALRDQVYAYEPGICRTPQRSMRRLNTAASAI